jgi:predicted acylesterase/phospholipase RssA
MTVPIQLAIQGGGAKITHLVAALEAVQALQRRGIIRVTRIAGTSAGAIAGALFAAGVDMQRARDAFEAHRDQLLRAFPPTTARLRAAWCLLTRRPFWDAAPLRRLLVKLLAPHEQLGDLAIPLVIVAADLTNMQACIYDEPHEPLISSLMDSAGIPYFLRTPPGRGREAYRIVVDGAVCENLPSDQLAYSAERGEVLGITFSTSRDGAPLCGLLDFARALLETALNTSVLRAQLALGPNNFVIRSEAGSFDFERAFNAGLGAEYRETRLLAEEFFRDYASRTAAAERVSRPLSGGAATEVPAARLQNIVTALRSMYRLQQEAMRFEFLLVRMVVTGMSQTMAAIRPPDQVCHEIVIRATAQPVSCYRIRLTASEGVPKTQCEVFGRNYVPIPFDLVPLCDGASEEREYLLFFREPVVPGDARSSVTVRVRDTVAGALHLTAAGQDELLARASRADGPIGRVEIVVHLPEELGDTAIAAAAGSGGTRMTPSELLRFPAPAGFITLGWKGDHVPPNTLFGCNLVKREGGNR